MGGPFPAFAAEPSTMRDGRARRASPARSSWRDRTSALGYYGRPDLTEQTFRPDGWQVTQDVGTFDADGSLRVVGRKRDLIIRGGLNVSPREVEELLLRIPGIADAAVVGWPDDRYGERICAFLVSSGAPPTVAELATAFAEMGVARYKTPERVEQVDALPLTTTGKVRHAALRELLTSRPDAR